MNKIRIDKNTVQETLIIPLYARKVCAKQFPDICGDIYSERLLESIEYDMKEQTSTFMKFGCLEGGMRQYDLVCEIKDYLKAHPKACVVNLGCGLDTSFYLSDNGQAQGYNLDQPDVIEIRNNLLPPVEREHNIPCDLNNLSWFDKINFRPEEGIVFIAGGVFYYFETEKVKRILTAMADRFPGGKIAMDVTTPLGLKIMLKSWIKEAHIDNVGAYFSLKNTQKELLEWSGQFASVTRKKYLTGYYPDIKKMGIMNRILSFIGDSTGLTQIAVINFKRVN